MSVQTPYGDPLVTGEAVAVEMRPAGIGSRGIGAGIDLTIQAVLIVVIFWLVIAIGPGTDVAGFAAILLSTFVLVILGYPVGFETLTHGRTPGKSVMGLRVVRDDGGPIRFRHAFVRGLVGVVVERPGIMGFVPALLCMLVNTQSKRLGDLAAGTIVVQERVPTRAALPPLMPAPLAAWAADLDLSHVPDGLALEIRHYLARSPQLAPWAREDIGRRLREELSVRTAPPPPDTPTWAYLSAVLAERRRRELTRLTPPPTTPVSQATVEPRNAADDGAPPAPLPDELRPPGPFAPPA